MSKNKTTFAFLQSGSPPAAKRIETEMGKKADSRNKKINNSFMVGNGWN